jgi:hypothetical protein
MKSKVDSTKMFVIMLLIKTQCERLLFSKLMMIWEYSSSSVYRCRRWHTVNLVVIIVARVSVRKGDIMSDDTLHSISS